MLATQQASELQASDEAYQQIFRQPPISVPSTICDLPLDKLVSFFTAEIGFRPYPPAKLKAFAEQLNQEGLLVRIIVRRIPGTDQYEILSGHNRTEAARLAGWTTIAAEIVEADDNRAISIAIITNLLQRQDLSIVERGKAYKALLEAKRKQGFRSDIVSCAFGDSGVDGTSGESRQKYSARAVVAEFFGVSEHEIRKVIKLTQLIPELLDILESDPKALNLACADIIADYNAESQRAFIEMCTIEGYLLNKATVQHIARRCPPPSADRQRVFEAWREARAEAEKRLLAPSKKISFDRKKFAPYLGKMGDKEIEDLFLEFLRSRAG